MRNIKVYSVAWYNVRYRGVKSYNRKKDRKKKEKRNSFHTFPNKNKVYVTTKSLGEKTLSLDSRRKIGIGERRSDMRTAF